MEYLSAALKVELHTHTDDDPVDRIPYTIFDLIDRAASLGYGALEVTRTIYSSMSATSTATPQNDQC